MKSCIPDSDIKRVYSIPSSIIILFLMVSPFVLPVNAATTEIRIVKYAIDGVTILAEKTVDYHWMEQNLRVYGDGVTHYFHQGPVFIDDPDPEKEQALRWNPAEDTNVQEKDMGAVKGTNLKDLCDLVGGMSPDEEVKIVAADGWYKWFAYKNVYEYSSREGPIIICWYKDGKNPDSGYSEGMRMVWFADASINPWGIHAFGVWDWHEAADPKYWYYYRQGDEKYPTTTGLSGMYISEILIYSQEEPAGSIEITSIPAGADIYLDGEETGKVTPFTMENIPAGSHTISVRKDGYIASDEEWIEVSHGMIIPVHFNLKCEYSPTISGSGDTSLTSKTSNNGEQAALEKLEDVIRGNISIYRSSGERQVCMSGQTLSYYIKTDHHLPHWTRLYIFSEAGYTNNQDIEIRVNNVKAGIPNRLTSYHPDGKVTETFALDITSLLQEATIIEVSIRNPPGGNEWLIYPPTIIVSYEDDEEQVRESRVAEGAVITQAVKKYSPQDLQNITIADFSDIAGGFSDAELVIIGTANKDYETSVPAIVQNSVVIPVNSLDNRDGIWIARFNISANASGYSHNELFWNSTNPLNTIEFTTRVAILSLTYPEKVASAEPSKYTPPGSEPNRTIPLSYENNLTDIKEISPTSPTQGIPEVKNEIPVQDVSFMVRLWKVIFWLFSTPFSEDETRFLGSEREVLQQSLGKTEVECNDTSSMNALSKSPITYTLNVSTKPQGASLTIFGQAEKKTSPATFILPSGDFLLTVNMDGYLGCKTLIHIPETQEITINLTYNETIHHNNQKSDSERSRHGGLLIITYPEDLKILVDNKPMVTRSPLIIYGIKEGAHTVKAIRSITGKDESIITRTWVYHDALSICKLDFIGIRLDRRIRIIDPSGNNIPFTLNGMYPLLRTPINIEIAWTESFVTLIVNDTYTSFTIPDSLVSGSEFSFPPYTGRYHAIRIESIPSGAEIFIDGARTGNTTPSLVAGLSEGPHRVMVSLPGYIPAQRFICVPRTNEEFIKGIISFTLDMYPSGPLRVESIPNGATIYINGLETGEKTPYSFSGIPVGVHELTLKSSKITRSRDITIRPDNTNRYVMGMD